MALNTFLDFSTTAASNVDVAGIGIQGANAVSNFDNAFRQLMAILRRDLDNGMVLTSKSANYTAVANDNNALIRFSAAATLSLTAAATLGADWHCWVMADGGAVIIDPNSTETINGATTITIPNGSSTLVICDGTNFRALEDYSLIAAKLDAVQNWVDVASATTTDIGAAASINVRITGTTTITGLGTVAAGTFRRVRFAGILTLTHNGTSLILPGAANITTAAGDVGEFVSEGSGNWRCVDYTRASGKPVVATSVAQYAYAEYTANTDLTTVIPYDDTIPQVTEGTEVLTVTITPTSTSNKVIIRGALTGAVGTAAQALSMAVFVNGGSNAIFASSTIMGGANYTACIPFEFEHSPGSTSAQTYTVRVGPSSGTARLNGPSTARRFGGISKCTLIAEERAA